MTRKPVLLPQAEDFRAEIRSLHALLAAMPVAGWTRPTLFKGWTPMDILGHLHMADHAAMASLDGRAAFDRHMARMRELDGPAGDLLLAARRWHQESSGPALLDRWHAFAEALADSYAVLDPRKRVPWGRGPEMSARSCISARQMEAWAHGQAIFDMLGVERREHDHIRNIVVLGVNTFAWAFRNRRLEPPEPCRIDLIAPSGARWEFNPSATDGLVSGSAIEFCQVVTQTRHVNDTNLLRVGDVATQWMAIAQCFAGAPVAPPPAGARRRAAGSGLDDVHYAGS